MQILFVLEPASSIQALKTTRYTKNKNGNTNETCFLLFLQLLCSCHCHKNQQQKSRVLICRQVHGPSAPSGPYPAAAVDLPSNNLHLYTEWSQWSSCSRCDRVSGQVTGVKAGSVTGQGGSNGVGGINRTRAGVQPAGVCSAVTQVQLGSVKVSRVAEVKRHQPRSADVRRRKGKFHLRISARGSSVNPGQLGGSVSQECPSPALRGRGSVGAGVR